MNSFWYLYYLRQSKQVNSPSPTETKIVIVPVICDLLQNFSATYFVVSVICPCCAERNGPNLFWLQKVPADTEPEEEVDSLEQESDKPRFTLQELRDVLQERNELKAQVFLLQEELAYYKRSVFGNKL